MLLAQSRIAAAPRPALLDTLSRWVAIARQRRALAALDDSALSDIGISRAAAQNEAQRPFWDAPDNWRI